MTVAQITGHQIPLRRLGIADRTGEVRFGIHHFGQAAKTLDTEEMHCELLQFVRGDAAELEFSLASHLILFLPDGMSGGCEWSDGVNAVKSSYMQPNTVLFNPARHYLWLRKKASQASSRMLLLTVAPNGISRLLGSDAADVTFEQRIGVDDDDVRRTLLVLLQEMESPGWKTELYVKTLLTLLLSQLARCTSNLTATRRAIYKKGGLPSWRLKRALALLEKDLCEAPSLVELARRLRLHPTSLCRAFKQSMGITPHRYLLLHRVKCAKEMMIDQSRTLTEIAVDCGFNSSSQFSLVFRRFAGMSPRQYRRTL
jgi:AraC family transcriptional regulator